MKIYLLYVRLQPAPDRTGLGVNRGGYPGREWRDMREPAGLDDCGNIGPQCVEARFGRFVTAATTCRVHRVYTEYIQIAGLKPEKTQFNVLPFSDKYILDKNINATCKVLVPCFMRWNKTFQKKSLFLSNWSHILVKQGCTSIYPSTWQVWHIKKLIKQHDHYTGAPCAGDNKRPL